MINANFIFLIMMIVISSSALSKIPDIKIVESSTYIQAEDHVHADDEGGIIIMVFQLNIMEINGLFLIN